MGISERWYSATTSFDRTILVPFPPESRGQRHRRHRASTRCVWYRRTFRRTAGRRTARLLLHFGAVDYRAEVWVNGRLVGRPRGRAHAVHRRHHRGADDAEGEQVVVVRAEDDPHDLAQPRGKQDWQREPHAIWYHRTTGIWQPVWLEPVPATADRASLRWTPDLDAPCSAWTSGSHRRADRRRLRLRRACSRQDGQVLADDTYRRAARRVRASIALRREAT